MYYGGRKDGDPEFRTMLSNPKEGTVPSKPSDVRNGDLVSLLLAATPPYLYNMPLVPQSFFFSEMLRSFVQAKSERQNLKTHQVHRRRKRAWRETTPPEADKPLELTTPRVAEKSPSPPLKKATPSCDFTAATLANSSVPPSSISATQPEVSTPNSTGLPMWYPSTYPNQMPYPIDPLHFFIDLRVSAHIWDRKIEEDKEKEQGRTNPSEPPEECTVAERIDIGRNGHKSAFSVPVFSAARSATIENSSPRSKQSVHYVMSNIKSIFNPKRETEQNDEEIQEKIDKKKSDDLRALIGLELVVDYVKQETDGSDDDDGADDRNLGDGEH